jgi:signal transduction histidine kinase
MNLFLNAEQAMPKGGTIFISSSRRYLETGLDTTVGRIPPGHYLVLAVADEGIGMSQAVAERACEPFFTTKDTSAHAGLGLTLVQGILRSMSGGVSLLAQSTGTTVELYLPLAAAEPLERKPTGVSPGLDADPLVPEVAPCPSNAIEHTSECPADCPTNGRWRLGATRRLLLAASAGFVLVAVVFWVQLSAWPWLVLVTLGVALALTSSALFVRRLPDWVAIHGLVFSVFLVGFTLVVNVTYMSPVAIVFASLSIVLSAELLGKHHHVFVALAVWFAFVLGGWMHAGRGGSLALSVLDPSRAANWVRTGVLMVLALSLFSMAVLHVVGTARQQLERTAAARRRLESKQAERTEATEAALVAERIAARAARTESAGKLTGTVAHDLNNSLQTMLAWAELLVIRDDDPTTDREALAGIEQATDYAEALIAELQLGAIEPLPVTSIDAGRALERMQPMLLSLLQVRGKGDLRLLLHVESGCHVRIQKPSLRRLLLNLVANARDAMTGAGTCSVRLAVRRSEVVLEVEDDGCGMDEATLARVTEAFFTTKGDRGTGLGLHSVSQLMRATLGRFEISSKVGQGTLVTLRWPLADSPRASLAVAPHRESRDGKGPMQLVESEV